MHYRDSDGQAHLHNTVVALRIVSPGDIDIAILSVCPYVRHVPVVYRNS